MDRFQFIPEGDVFTFEHWPLERRERHRQGVRLIAAEAVADLVVLFASDRFRVTTGDILTVDGGLPEAFPR